MNEIIKGYTDEFIERIKTSDEYIAYKNKVNVIRRIPDLMNQINEYRDENFRLQNTYEGDELFDKTEELQNRYDNLLNDSNATLFLHAEADFVKMLQEINYQILEGLDFQ